VGYKLDDLREAASIREVLEKVHAHQKLCYIRLSFHPDRFVTISSQRIDVVENSLRELEYHGVVSELIGADVINMHGGGAFGDKVSTMQGFRKNFERLSARVQTRLGLENDVLIYTVADLYPVCLVYDVHHHRCDPDGIGVEEATRVSVETWDRAGKEPYFHISSPAMGWEAKNPRKHADYIELNDFPNFWTDTSASIDVEAKAKELAVIKLMVDLGLVHKV
jgi:UV DNA damage endonuclease